MRDQTSYAYTCPSCGVRETMQLRDHEGGMWLHLKCQRCGCKFDYKMGVSDKMLDVDEQARRAVAALSNRQLAALARVLSKVRE